MISPAQAKNRPTALAKPSSPRTQAHMNRLLISPITVTIRKTQSTMKNSS